MYNAMFVKISSLVLTFKVNEGRILSSKSASKKLGFSFLLDPQINDQLTDVVGRLVTNFFDGFKVPFYKLEKLILNKRQYFTLATMDNCKIFAVIVSITTICSNFSHSI